MKKKNKQEVDHKYQIHIINFLSTKTIENIIIYI